MYMMSIEEADKVLDDLLPGFKFRIDSPLVQMMINDSKLVNLIISESNNEITSIYIDNETYKIWSVKYITPFLINFLKEKVPNGLITRETNDIDFVIIDTKNNDIIPVELQRVIKQDNTGFQSAHFEKVIRKQIDDNINSSGKCWFFFDSEYLRYFQNGNLNNTVNIDMNWFVEYMKEEKLKVFSIHYNGTINELTTKDFDFLKEIHTEDEVILDKNKLKIYRDVLKGYNFTQNELDNYYKEYDDLIIEKKNNDNMRDLLLKSENIRNVLHMNIIRSLRTLPGINEVLNMKMVERRRLYEAGYLGIFELVNSGGNRSIMKFIDKFNICKYFPGYLKNKEVWDRYKNYNLSNNQMNDLCKGLYKNVKRLESFE